jgi:uncharacterized spore protein YtfJ
MDIDNPIKTTVEEIRKVLNIENVIGETIETDEFLMIPVTRMGMGFGAGMGEGKGQDNMECRRSRSRWCCRYRTNSHGSRA